MTVNTIMFLDEDGRQDLPSTSTASNEMEVDVTVYAGVLADEASYFEDLKKTVSRPWSLQLSNDLLLKKTDKPDHCCFCQIHMYKLRVYSILF